MKVFSVWVMSLIFCFGLAHGGGNKEQPLSISFHIETEGGDNPKMVFPFEVMGSQRIFRRIPDVSSKDFVAFSPFPSDDQTSYGVVFQLKDSARRRFAAVTSVNQGKWLVCQAFGRVIDAVLVDAPVDDGVIVAWKNFSIEEIHEIDKTLPRIGEKRKK